ncbi:MAG: threo-3-hydroxy-L-aspartate ammonia-lyase [Planctomycetes bacterium]|nr:threo-3-hydroxy-L-aspartate ammonia-lyase [Planctomycetota bacterium]
MAGVTTLVDIRAAAGRIAGVAHVTPVHTSRSVNEHVGAEVFFKCENFQRVGAFKFRGAYNALSQLSPEQRKGGVLTYSSGNHAQAIALAGKLLGIATLIVMPDDSPEIKQRATRGYGAEIVLYNKRERTREELGGKLARERGMTIIPPYDHADIIAGQGTTALELHEQVPGLDVLLAPCGGGGLLSGCAVATKALNPACEVIGVEPATADDATRSFKKGELQTVLNPPTIADGARTPSLGELTFPLLLEYVDEMVTVPDTSIVAAMRFLWERMKLVVEPTGALAYAAIHSSKLKRKGKRIGVIISGGNVDVAGVAKLFV